MSGSVMGRMRRPSTRPRRPRAVGRDELIEALWGGAPPPNCASALTVLLSKLRSGVGADVLAGRGCLGLGGTELPGAERAARRLVEHNPLRETGDRLLMEALAARGNVAEALGATSGRLWCCATSSGIPPGPVIHELHATLLGRAR
jgi:DNA-binding SARP family transcriptional activator